LDLYVLIFPRGGEFSYSSSEFQVMREDLRRARELGADGVVLGVLTRDDHVDVERTARLVDEARPMKVTFNRAFDVSTDLDRALEDVAQSRCDRILTSGGRRTGILGAQKLRQLVRAAGQRVVIMGGGGVRPSNVREFIEATGVSEVHTSLRFRTQAPPQPQKTDVILGTESGASLRYVVTSGEVARLRKVVNDLAIAAR
jgi:copper homeostasis protein